MAKCKTCGSMGVTRNTLHEYRGDLLGAPFNVVVQDAVVEERCAGCGTKKGIMIPNLQGLVAAVAMTRALEPTHLTGGEIRFLRKSVGWKAKDLAKQLNVSPSHISRCETGKEPLGAIREKYLRLYACVKLAKSAPRIDFSPDDFENMEICWVRDMASSLTVRMYLVQAGEKTAGDPGWKTDRKAA